MEVVSFISNNHQPKINVNSMYGSAIRILNTAKIFLVNLTIYGCLSDYSTTGLIITHDFYYSDSKKPYVIQLTNINLTILIR